MTKFKLESLDSPYVIINGQAGEFYYSIAHELCLKYGSDPYNHSYPFTASVNNKGELITPNDQKLANIWDLNFVNEKTYLAAQYLNIQGYQITK